MSNKVHNEAQALTDKLIVDLTQEFWHLTQVLVLLNARNALFGGY